MKSLKRAGGALLFAAAMLASGASSAIPIVHVVDPNPNVSIPYLGSYSYVHDLTVGGFVPGVDTLDSASMSLLLRDDAGNEVFQFEVGLGQVQGFQNVNNGSQGELYAFALTAPSLLDLALDGLINVTIRSLAHSNSQFQTGFIFDHSTLTAQVTKGVSGTSPAGVIPEPSMLLLLGAALAGLGFATSRRARRK